MGHGYFSRLYFTIGTPLVMEPIAVMRNALLCLAHLIRKAIALTQVVNKEASDLGQWLLEELRELIQTLSSGDGDNSDDPINQVIQIALYCVNKIFQYNLLNFSSNIISFPLQVQNIR